MNFETLSPSEAVKSVKGAARFIRQIGSKLKDKLKEAIEFQNKQEEIKSTPVGDVSIDATDVQIRLRIGKKLWAECNLTIMDFDRFVEFLTQ